MASLPIFQAQGNTTLQLMQTKWASILNPLIALPTNNPSLISGIAVVNGVNTINHKLGHTPQGWILVDTTAAITLFRSAAFDPLTLTLTSNGASTIALMVF